MRQEGVAELGQSSGKQSKGNAGDTQLALSFFPFYSVSASTLW